VKINKRTTIFLAIPIALLIFILIIQKSLINKNLTFTCPLNYAVFPADIAAPTFKWSSNTKNNTNWELTFKKGWNTTLYQTTTNCNNWRPDKET
jgi:hypothetical protein